MQNALILKKNSFFNLLSSIARVFSNSLIFFIVARTYGVEEFGSFSTAHSITTLFLVIADFGFDVMLSTEIAKDKNKINEIISRVIPVKATLCILTLILIWILVYLMELSFETKVLILIFGFNTFFTSLLNMIFSSFKGVENFKIEANLVLIINLLLLAFVLLGAIFKISLIFIAILFVLFRILSFLFAFRLFYMKYGLEKLIFTFNNIRNELKKISKYGLDLIFGTLLVQIDSVLILLILGETEVGFYQSVVRIILLTLVVPTVLVGAALPTISRIYYSSNSIENKYKIFNSLVKISFLISIPIFSILFIFNKEIVILLYGTEFLKAVPLLKIASFIIFIRYMAEPFAMMLTVNNNQQKRTAISFVGFLFNLLFNYFLIPKYGIEGSIFISLFTNIIVFVLYVIFSNMFRNLTIIDYKTILVLIFLPIILIFSNNLSLVMKFIVFTIALLSFFLYTFKYLLNNEEKKILSFTLTNNQ